MITRARRAIPGMVVSMLLAGPALAAPATSATDQSAANHARRADAKRVTAKIPLRKPQPAMTSDAAYEPADGLVYLHRSIAEDCHIQDGPIWSDTPGHLVTAGPTDRPAYTPASYTRTSAADDSASNLVGFSQSGTASWYGGARWQGRRTSSGERYDENALTAAHATLPIGAKVRVALADNSKTVIVTITDRPGTRTRIIDLSRAAAAELGILSRGIAQVTLSSN